MIVVLATAGLAAAGGVGACANGSGTTVRDVPVGAYVGVNVGSNSGIFTSQAEFEAACCAETGREPDCFRPVQ